MSANVQWKVQEGIRRIRNNARRHHNDRPNLSRYITASPINMLLCSQGVVNIFPNQ